MSEKQNARKLGIGPFMLDLKARELRRRGIKVRLPGQAFQILRELALEQPEPVTRERLEDLLWPDDVHVDKVHGLNAAVATLRTRLGDTANKPAYVETLPKVGYRFVAPVEVLEWEDPARSDSKQDRVWS